MIPVWLIQKFTDTNSLSAQEDLNAKVVGWELANALNVSIASGATSNK